MRSELLDIRGSVAATTIAGYRSAGESAVQIDASHLPAGIDFVTLESRGKTTHQKVVLVK